MRIVALLLCSLAVVCIFGAASVSPKPRNESGPAFPRLAMWHPRSDWNTLEESARYDMAVGNFQEPYRGFSSFHDALKSKNKDIQLLTYFTSSVIRHTTLKQGSTKYNPYMKNWPDRWFLTEAGTTTAAAIDAKQETISVKDWHQTGPIKGRRPKNWDIFRVDYDILCDGEIMTVLEVDGASKTLTVERGMSGTKAKAHSAGVRIAPIVRFWRGSYMMNLTTDCPTARLDGAGSEEQYSDYSFRMSKRGAADWWWYTGGDQDGFLFDLMADTISWVMWADTRSIDLNHDNVADPFAEMDKKWIGGINHVTDLFHKAFPGKPIIRNQSRSWRFVEYNGENFESWPRNAWDSEDIDEPRGRTKYWHRYFFGSPEEERGPVVDFATKASKPNFTLIETADIETDLSQMGMPEIVGPNKKVIYKPDYRKMRWGLSSALLTGIYYAWVIHTDGHGMLGMLWFDEYDDSGAGQGYLGYPKGEIVKLLTDKKNKNWGVWGREYDNGYVVCNPLDVAVTVTLPAGKWVRLKGTQDKDVNTGLAVTDNKVSLGPFDGLILKRGS
jgi:hypothetical protein